MEELFNVDIAPDWKPQLGVSSDYVRVGRLIKDRAISAQARVMRALRERQLVNPDVDSLAQAEHEDC